MLTNIFPTDNMGFVAISCIDSIELYTRKEVMNMKSAGIVRKLDELGRITLPIELRRNLNISERDPLEIFVDDERIILKKYQPCDIFTGDMEELIDYQGKKVSKRSIIEMAKIAGLSITE